MAFDEGPFMRIVDVGPWISDRENSVNVFVTGTLNPADADCFFNFDCSPADISSLEWQSLLNSQGFEQFGGYTTGVAGQFTDFGNSASKDATWENGDDWEIGDFISDERFVSVPDEKFPCLGGGSNSVIEPRVSSSVLQNNRPPDSVLADDEEWYEDIIFEVQAPELFDKTCVQDGDADSFDPDQGGELIWKYDENSPVGTGLTLSAKTFMDEKGLFGRKYKRFGRWWQIAGIVAKKNSSAGNFDVRAIEIADPTMT